MNRLNRKLARRRMAPRLPGRDPIFLFAVGLLIAILVSLCSSCSPLPSGGYRETSPSATVNATVILDRPTSFTVIESVEIPNDNPDAVPYSRTRIRRVSIR
jgi:hypothetical protein